MASAGVPSPTDKQWTAFRPRRPNATLRLFCFSWAGGSSAGFAKWRSLPPWIELVVCELPGRMARGKEPLLQDIPTMARLGVAAFHREGVLTDKPFAVYGHSMGSKTAYEFTLELQRKGLPLPVAFIVSGAKPPHVPQGLPVMSGLPRESLVAELQAKGGMPQNLPSEVLDLYLPVLRADYRALEEYTGGQAKEPLPLDITCFLGSADKEAPLELTPGWADFTLGSYRQEVFQGGGHFFLLDMKDEVLPKLVEVLTEATQPGPKQGQGQEQESPSDKLASAPPPPPSKAAAAAAAVGATAATVGDTAATGGAAGGASDVSGLQSAIAAVAVSPPPPRAAASAPAPAAPKQRPPKGPSLASDKKWTAFRPRRPDATFRLFCFAWAGGSSAGYLSWRVLPPWVEVVVCELPGRQSRNKEPFLEDIPEAARQAVGAFYREGLLDDKPFALYGHSMGTKTAYEFCRQLERNAHPLPLVMMLSGALPPDVAEPPPLMSALARPALLREMKAMGGIPSSLPPDILDLFVPVIRADYKALESYQPHGLARDQVRPDLVCFLGSDDGAAPLELTPRWADFTLGSYRQEVFQGGGHFFLLDMKDEVCGAIVRVLTEYGANP